MTTIPEINDKLWGRLPPPEVAASGSSVHKDDGLSSGINRFQRAQMTHAGLHPDEAQDFAYDSALATVQRVAAEPQYLLEHVYSAVSHAMIVAALQATGLDLADARWDDEEELDESAAGGYVHGITGAIVRLKGVTDEGQHVVLFDAGQSNERVERWCAEHFAVRFTPIEDVPILGEGS